MANVYLCVPVNFPWIATRKSWQMSRCCIGVFPHSSFNPENLLYSSISLRGESILNVFFFYTVVGFPSHVFCLDIIKKILMETQWGLNAMSLHPLVAFTCFHLYRLRWVVFCRFIIFFLTMLNIKHMYHGIHSRRT